MYAVAADIHQAAAAVVEHVADIVGIIVEVGEPAVDGDDFSDLATLDELPGPLPGGMELVHEGFTQNHAVVPGGADHRLGLSRAQCDRLLAEDVLAGAGGRYGPFGVHMIGERDIDRIDLVVVE